MSLLPQTASFEELVQDCFLTHRGAGLMLSPLDVEVVMAWAAAEVPFEVVARGIRKAAEKAIWDARPGEPALRTLRACKKDVEAEIRKYRARSVGKGEVREEGAAARSFEEERHHKLRAAVAKLGREQPSLQGVAQKLLGTLLQAPPADLAGADLQEDKVICALLRSLPIEQRRALYKEITAHGCADPLMSPHARKLSRRFHRHALVRRALSLPTFW